ncbi:MAG: hypothetical protein LUH59_05430 [Firmicutes bacterium]|nr:hypothetical protein [Bacillota bacterium]
MTKKFSVKKLLVLLVILVLAAMLIRLSYGFVPNTLSLSYLNDVRFNPEYYPGACVCIYIDGKAGEYTMKMETARELLMIDEWEIISNVSASFSISDDESKTAGMTLDELYEMTIYDTYAIGYYGYRNFFENEYVYYSIPSEVAENFVSYAAEIKSAEAE